MGVDWSPAVGEGKDLVDINPVRRGPRRGRQVDRRPARVDVIEATLGSINFVIGGLRELPGRKGVIVFSDGLRLFQDVVERQSIVAPGLRGRAARLRARSPRRARRRSPTRGSRVRSGS